ncbi:MAG: YicC family protein [Candidatus Omnitrophica bacterium]|nr:YicC family protein [Candidatus Omnitrophota bacterium]
MIKSMTGFGQSVGGKSPDRWSVEIRSWNHRFFECSTRLPNVLSGLDEKIRDFVHSHIKRGKITVAISFRSKQVETNGLVLDEKKIDSYIRALRKIQKKYRLKDPISVSTLLGVPSLFTVDHEEHSAEYYWGELKQVLEKAVKELIQAKVREGAALTQDLKKRIGFMHDSLLRVEALSKNLPGERRSRLQERISELAEGVALDSTRLEQEVALLAERSDITEELVRIKHHLDFLKKSLANSEEVGKKLDFIAQEVHREVNTIASKAQNFGIAEEVICVKSELEKIREQVQNIE